MGRKRTVKRNYDNEGKLISKECSCCHKIKTVSEFGKDRSKIDGLKLKCKECNKQYYKDNAEYFKQYQKDNAEYYKEYLKEYYTKKAQESLQQIKIEVEANPEKYDYTEGKDIYGII